MTTLPAPSLAERKRRLVADELTKAALSLLVQQGFDAVTVDEIAASAGMSKRTFFRYFASKEDVVVRFLAELGAGMRAELAARPAGESPSTALRHTVRAAIDACAGHADHVGLAGRADHARQTLRVVQLILGTPALHARFLERQANWREELAAELATRLGLDLATSLYPRLAAGTALTAFDVVLQRWSAGDGTDDPAALTDQAFAAVAPALDATPR
ncbi:MULTISPECIES: TetR family transcriptional regulator [Kitasatospora]|uniref:TetR family transcriptional regulator n=1 Tax=Kitasatospora cathayae TaxID=3004092 RepID=A0ABY7Q385_9ACTN|nr:TetR family transcriptional regulator [Kitasatospora sp. HUAS 3-15]WBP87102.1 TetR family transcriptional regulator [Kitasatospora sp. HUAS 3-15]